MEFVFIILPAFLACIIMKIVYKHDITLKEFGIHLGVIFLSAALLLGLTYASLYSKMYDTEILNGEVLSKSRHVEYCTQSSDCEHYTTREICSYSTNSKGERTKSCYTYKDFDYTYEVDWYVKTSVDRHKIKRVNNQGTKVPPRWGMIQIGDPASTTSSYMNYLLGSEDSLFYQAQYEKDFTPEFKKSLPDYPRIYDYYRVDHVLNLTNSPSTGYNDYISDVLRKMGKEQQVNIVMVMYPYDKIDFVKGVLAKWRGGKKNDVIMFFGLDTDGTVKKFDSTSFGKGMKNEFLHSKLRMTALTEKMSIDLVKATVYDVQTDFKRLPNKEFEYLKYKLEPSNLVIAICSVLAFLISIGVGVYMRKVDL